MLQLLGFIIDCPDPMKPVAFYAKVTGHPVIEGSGDTTAGLSFGEVDLLFQRVVRICSATSSSRMIWLAYSTSTGRARTSPA